jgi:CTP:molybdopterin cytidylyltransferase MocA
VQAPCSTGEALFSSTTGSASSAHASRTRLADGQRPRAAQAEGQLAPGEAGLLVNQEGRRAVSHSCKGGLRRQDQVQWGVWVQARPGWRGGGTGLGS